MIDVPSLLKQLVAFESITPHDNGCQAHLIQILKALGFHIEVFDNAPVSNFFARIGNNGPLLVFAGHTDVVPTGDASKWHNQKPFELFVQDTLAFGRGTADMKGSIAAMIKAAEQFLAEHLTFKGSLGFLITSGEEGDDFDKGTPFVMDRLKQQGITPDFCIVGEPTSHQKLADTIKIGRRGSLTGKFIIEGIQGHVAYPHLAQNPIHTLAPALSALTQHEFDQGNQYFSPTSLQVTNIQAGGQANNVIPGELILQFNIRYSTEQTADDLMQFVEALFKSHKLNYKAHWRINGEPFITEPGILIEATVHAIQDKLGYKPTLSTTGGTSDARFIAPHGVEVIELGPIHASIHQINEHVCLDDLTALSMIYYEVMKRLLS